jgi:hypothetical protein
MLFPTSKCYETQRGQAVKYSTYVKGDSTKKKKNPESLCCLSKKKKKKQTEGLKKIKIN